MILRILNPPHAGAQAEIGSEPLTIGSGADCDLVLSDPLLQPAHCKIRLEGEGIEVELTGGAAHLDGDPVEKSPFTLRAGQVLSIGSTHIAFGNAGEVWPPVSIPTLKTLGGAAPVSAEASAVSDWKKPEASDPSVEAKATLVRRFKLASIGIVAMLVVLVMAMFFYRAEQKRAMSSMARMPGGSSVLGSDYYRTDFDNKAAEEVAEKIRREISGSTVTTYERSGRAVLRVYVRSREQASQAQSIVNSAGTSVFSEIVSLMEIEKSAEMIASMQGFELDATFSKDGVAYWSGFMPAPSDWKALLQRLEVDLPLIKENVSEITFASQIQETLQKLLTDAGIRVEVAMNTQPRAIVFYGTMPENLSASWTTVFDSLKQKYGTIVELKDDVGTGKAVVVQGNPFHSEIVGVTLGAIPSVVLLDGQRIYRGAILADGSVLESITQDHLILQGPQGNRKVPLSIGAGSDNPLKMD